MSLNLVSEENNIHDRTSDNYSDLYYFLSYSGNCCVDVAEHPVFVRTEEQEDIRDSDSSHRDLLSEGFDVNGVTLYF